ncbi:MAG: ATP-binding protein [Promethearchaeia archaeon]
MTKLGKNIGQFVSGSFDKLILRQKADQTFEIGQLLVAGTDLKNYSIYQINDLKYGSQIPGDSLELMAGYQLEREHTSFQIYEPELRNYVLAEAKALVKVSYDPERDELIPVLPKTLPSFFQAVCELNNDHLSFLKERELKNPIGIGKVRSGSQILDTEVNLEARDVLTHHILIPATTGRGKSNLVKVMLYNILENEDCGILVFDAHNEYYDSLKEHPKSSEFLKYYSIRGIPGSLDLKFNTKFIQPSHIRGAISLTNAQRQALTVYHRDAKSNDENWIKNLFTKDLSERGVATSTQSALRRKIGILLHIKMEPNDTGVEEPIEGGIYRFSGYETTVTSILDALEDGKTVVVDTSLLGGNEEIFVATIIVEKLFAQYKNYKFNDLLKNYPVISVVLEEAPRVIGKKVLEAKENIFGTIAKEGRKFDIGLIAITQLPSIIPREILANMNTKIVLGNEMGPERKAIIESAAQDLSKDSQTIGSLDKGEAIVTSNFTKFAIPIKIPLFEDLVKKEQESSESQSYAKKGVPGL